jgi:hypothetical protein
VTSTVAEPDRGQVAFLSVDSAPRRFASAVSVWRAPLMLLVFLLISLGLLTLVNIPALSGVFPNHDFIFSPYAGNHSVAIRTFVISFFLAFGLFASARPAGRVLFALDLTVTFAVLCAVFDLANVVGNRVFGIVYSLHFIEIVSGLMGFAVFSFKLLERGRMPVRIQVEHRPARLKRAATRLILTFAIAAAVSIYVGGLDLPVVETLRSVALLGGIGPGVFLLLPCFFGQLYALAI